MEEEREEKIKESEWKRECLQEEKEWEKENGIESVKNKIEIDKEFFPFHC